MKRFMLSALMCVLVSVRVEARGGLFNRFSPEILANLGYGGHSGHVGHSGGGRSQPYLQMLQSDGYGNEEETFSQENDEPCYGKRCTANEHCCLGSVCVDVDGVVGSCLFAYGRKVGELCRRDNDCESGLICTEGTRGGAPVCRPPTATARQYAEDCASSADCDISRGLCCQLQRRHRQAPRKVCSYFKDPLVCIGTVASDQVKADVQHTAGEKRITYKHQN